MNKFIYSLLFVWILALGFTANTNAEICRPAVDCKAGTADNIGWATQNFFNDGFTTSWNFQLELYFKKTPMVLLA